MLPRVLFSNVRSLNTPAPLNTGTCEDEYQQTVPATSFAEPPDASDRPRNPSCTAVASITSRSSGSPYLLFCLEDAIAIAVSALSLAYHSALLWHKSRGRAIARASSY